MTDKTRQDSGSTHIIRYALELGLLWIDGDGRDKVREALDALDILEAQLEAVGAGGVQSLSQKKATPASVDKAQAAINSGAGRVQALSAAPAIIRELESVLCEVDQLFAATDCSNMSAWHGRVARHVKDALSGARAAIAASPIPPPAEQQAITPETEFPVSAQGAAITSESGAVYAPMPRAAYIEFDGREETAWHTPDQMRDFADRTHALRMEQAAPKAAPSEGGDETDWYHGITEKHFDRAVQKAIQRDRASRAAAPKAAPGEQNAVSAEWLEQAYREGWAACRDAETIGEEAEDWAFGNSAANSRMIDAQQAAPKAAPVKACVCGESQASGTVHRVDGPCYVAAPKAAPGEPSDAEIDAFLDSPGGLEWVIADKRERYRLLVRAALAKWAAPQQEAQEPYAYAVYFPDQPKVELVHDLDELIDDLTNRQHTVTKLYTAPQPAPAPLSDDTERLNWLLWKLPGDALRYVVGELADTSSGAEFRAAIDAAIAAQGGKA